VGLDCDSSRLGFSSTRYASSTLEPLIARHLVLDPDSLRLIAITDNLRDGVAGLLARALAAERGGVTMVHLRLPDETPRMMVRVARALLDVVSVPVLVHDRVDVALAAGAHGVHLSAREPAPAVLRRVVPPGFVIGVSVGDVSELTRAAGADYLGVGPVFASRPGESTVLGMEGLSDLARRATCPVVAIGGISPSTLPEALRAGAKGAAVLSALFAAADPESAARALRGAELA
jgi:thiamine-phosphate pyrophosphorylase